MRIGLITDLHWTSEPPSVDTAWHGGGDFTGVLDRLAAALEHFQAERVERIIVAGDLSHHGDRESLLEVLDCLEAASAPVGLVNGNHDVAEGYEALAHALGPAADQRLGLLGPDVVEGGGLTLTGVHVGECEGWFGARLREHPSPATLGSGPVVLVSHYPALSLATPIAAAGLPYPGDLVDREAFAHGLRLRAAPTIVLSGHVHARTSAAEGAVLQLTAGALVEPPYECATVDLKTAPGGNLSLTRRCVRLRESSSPLQPIFAPEHEQWRFAHGVWERSGVGPVGGSEPSSPP